MMRNNPIHRREEGYLQPFSSFNALGVNDKWKISVKFIQSRFLNIRSSISPNARSKVIWLKGQQNYLITLDSHGRAVLHCIFPFSPSLLLNKPHEKVFKMALSKDWLFMVVKSSNFSSLKFFKISTETLLNYEPIRLRILHQLTTQSDCIQDIDEIREKIIIKQSGCFEIWCLDRGIKEHSINLSNGIDAIYSKGMIVIMAEENCDLMVLVHDLSTCEKFNLVIKRGCLPYYSEIIGGRLLIGMSGREVQLVDYLRDGESLSLGKCIRCYCMEGVNDVFMLMSNYTGFFVSQPSVVIKCGHLGSIFVNDSNRFYAFSEQSRSIKILERTGVVGEIKVENANQLSAIGVNMDSRCVYAGSSRGEVSVFE